MITGALEEAGKPAGGGARNNDLAGVGALTRRAEDERDDWQDVPEWRKHGATSFGNPAISLKRPEALRPRIAPGLPFRDGSPVGNGPHTLKAPLNHEGVNRPLTRD